MPEISGHTLVMAIQAVDAKINDIEHRLATDSTEYGADLESLLLSYEKAASALEAAYSEALRSLSNLPTYESLVKKNGIQKI